MPKSPIAALCTPDNFIRSTMVSDTFRAPIILNGAAPLIYDVERIQVPFNPTRAAYIKKRFGLTSKELDNCYRGFSQGLRNGLSIVTRLHKDPSFAKGDASIITYTSVVFDKHDDGDGYDVYFICKPMTRYLDSPFCEGGKISFKTFINLAVRILMNTNYMHSAGAYIGALDIDSLCLTKAPPDAKSKEFMSFTALHYARSDSDPMVFPYSRILPAYAHPSLLDGGQPNDMTDTYSIAAVLASFTNGTAGSDHPSFVIPDNGLPEQLVSALRSALAGEMTSSGLMSVIRTIKKKMPAMQSEGGEVIEFSIIRNQPDLLYRPEEENTPEPSTEGAAPAEEAPDELSEELDGGEVEEEETAEADVPALDVLPGSFVLEDRFLQSFFPEELRRTPAPSGRPGKHVKEPPAKGRRRSRGRGRNDDEDDEAIVFLEED